MKKLKKYIVSEGFVGLLYVDGASARALKPVKHKLRRTIFDGTRREVRLGDLRERSFTIQECIYEDVLLAARRFLASRAASTRS